MNYEELLESRNGVAMNKEQTPFGLLYKKMVDQKYVNVLDLRHVLTDSLVFCDAIVAESEKNKLLNDNHQLHFTVNADSAGIYGVNIEQGSYRTFQHLLDDNPAVVAGKNFLDNTVGELLRFATKLNENGIYHLCYAPSNVLARKGDNSPMLLFHGSAYLTFRDQSLLYEGCEDFVAPEVLDEGEADERSEVYGIGRFMEFLYKQSSVPYELGAVIKKATEKDPEKRYASPADMLSAINTRMRLRRSLLIAGAALVATALFFGLFFSLVPEQEDIEYVTPAPKSASEDPFSDEYDTSASDIEALPDTLSEERVDEKKMKEYEAKAEAIFRKRYAQEADRILSKVYNNENMNSTEKDFISQSSYMTEELVKAQMKLGQDAGLTDTHSQRIASEIIEMLTAQKKKAEKAKMNAPADEPAKSSVEPVKSIVEEMKSNE